MTTIAFKDGMLATDSRYAAGPHILGKGKKIWVFEKGVVVGSGSIVGIETFLSFYQGKEYKAEIFKDEENEIDILVFDPTAKKVISYDKHLIAYEYDAPFYAIGSGTDYAIGAMAFGATPKEAVLIASQYDKGTDGNIQELKIW